MSKELLKLFRSQYSGSGAVGRAGGASVSSQRLNETHQQVDEVYWIHNNLVKLFSEYEYVFLFRLWVL